MATGQSQRQLGKANGDACSCSLQESDLLLLMGENRIVYNAYRVSRSIQSTVITFGREMVFKKKRGCFHWVRRQSELLVSGTGQNSRGGIAFSLPRFRGKSADCEEKWTDCTTGLNNLGSEKDGREKSDRVF